MHGISVVILTKNSFPRIKRTLQSLRDQKVKPDEIIVVDKDSNDGTLEFLSQFNDISVSSQASEGLARARNEAISICKGKFIAFLDSDDEWHKNKLHEQYLELEQDRNLLGVTCLLIKKDGSGPGNHKYPALTPSGFLLHKRAFDTYGRFDPVYKIGCDHAWIMRARRQGFPFKIIPKVLLIKNIHESNLSGDKFLYRKEMMDILRRYS